jgi:hypothetical protein
MREQMRNGVLDLDTVGLSIGQESGKSFRKSAR